MLDNHAVTVAPFTEVLTAPSSGHLIGYRLPGYRPGPTVVIATSKALLEPVSSRLAALPTISWIRGTLILVDIDAIGDGAWGSPKFIDATLALPFYTGWEAAEAHGYWSILRICTHLGMIDGRGVTLR